MNGRERIMTALSHGTPDRVPATPDISTMIPILLSGAYFYDPLDVTMAYVKAAKQFGIDGWMFNGSLHFKTNAKISFETKMIKDTYDVKEFLTIMHTPDGDLTSKTVSPRDVPATTTEKFVKNIKTDYKKLLHMFTFDYLDYDKKYYMEQKEAIGDTGMICCFIDCPGFQHYSCWMDLEELTYAYYDYPDIFEEICELHDRQCVRKMELAADAGVESILTGGSGSITLQSPELFRKLSLPTIKKITKMTKEAGLISGIHSCGKEFALIEMCANETDLDYVNPIEIKPQGDCDLADIKRKFGSKLALMGNLHTSRVMLGPLDLVRLEALKCIRDAAAGGGFVLSTGDQCGKNTPIENIFEIVKVAQDFGTYPLDIDKIDGEIRRLENKGVKMPDA